MYTLRNCSKNRAHRLEHGVTTTGHKLKQSKSNLMMETQMNVLQLLNQMIVQQGLGGSSGLKRRRMESPGLRVSAESPISVGVEACLDVAEEKELKTQSAGSQKTWQVWSQVEDVILVGCVMDMFFERGSLTSSKGGDVWEEIKLKLDLAVEKYVNYIKQNISEREITFKLPEFGTRSPKALKRHYKTLKERAAKEKLLPEGFKFKSYFIKWEQLKNLMF